MKIEALDHPKTLDLAARLEVELPTAIGHLELLWAFAARKTPRGDVGRWSDGVIAQAAMWRGKPEAFVSALVGAGFLDPDPDHRLLVHDWPEHCPNWVRSKLRRDGLEFAHSGALKSAHEPALKTPLKTPLKTGAYVGTEEGASTGSNTATSTGSSRADLNQAKPSQAKPSQAHHACARAREPRPDDADGGVDGFAQASRVQAPPDVPRGTFALSEDFESFLVATYPQTAHRRDFVTAVHSAAGIVGEGLATEADLRRRVAGFRKFVDSGGFSDSAKVPTPQAWFRRHQQGEAYWAREWSAPVALKVAPVPLRRRTAAEIEAEERARAAG